MTMEVTSPADAHEPERPRRILELAKANFLISYRRYWRRRISPDTVSRALPRIGSIGLVNATAIAVVALIILVVAADPLVLALVHLIDPGFKQMFLDWQVVGKASWMLAASGIPAIVLLGLGYTSESLRRRVRYLHLATISGYVFWAVVLPGIVAATLKQAIGRTRPFAAGDAGNWNFAPWTGYEHASFPSGDVCNAGALAMALGLLFPRLRPAFAAYAIFVAFERVASERHYLSDALAGGLLGAAGACMLALWLARRGHVFDITPKGALRLRGNRIFRF